MAYDVTTKIGQVRLTISDTTDDPVFADTDIAAFLEMAKDNVDRASARALDVIATDEALTSKYIRTQDISTDGPKVAAALREHAKQLRADAAEADDAADEGFFTLVPMTGTQHAPELTEHQHFPGYWP